MPQAVYFLMLPQVLSLDVSGPAETLRLAGTFSLHYIGPEPQVTCSIGMTLSRLEPLPWANRTMLRARAGNSKVPSSPGGMTTCSAPLPVRSVRLIAPSLCRPARGYVLSLS